MKYCPECGKVYKGNDKNYCSYCGTELTVKNKINIKTNRYFTINIDSYGQVRVDTNNSQFYIYNDINNKVLSYDLINEDTLINCLKQMRAQYPNSIKINPTLLYARIKKEDNVEFAVRLFSVNATFSVFNIPKEKLFQFLTKLETEFNHIDYSYVIKRYNESTSFLSNYETLLPDELKLKIEITK